MTMEPAHGPNQQFTRVYLPLAVCVASFALFLFTLNRWVSLNNWGAATFFTSSNGLFQTARLNGWVWQPQIYEPLYWLLTWPAHWLPARCVPIALNLFSAVCAALALGLLARSVALLPHDRTDVQRQKAHGADALLGIPTAWLPPLFAVSVCALQLTFWEHATTASGEMLD